MIQNIETNSTFPQKLSQSTTLSLLSNTLFEKYKKGNISPLSAFKPYSTDISIDSISSCQEENNHKGRGNYRKYTLAEKEQAVFKIMNGQDVKQVSEAYGIPRRNLLRWKKNGCERKEGGGRPTNIELQNILHDKIKKQQIKGEKQIRQMAMQVCKSENFKASKGWYSKFCRRFKVKTGQDI